MIRRRRQDGFALLLTLVLVVIAAALLAGLTRRSAVRAIEARLAVEELQRRWAMATAGSVLVDRVEPVLRKEEGREGPAAGDGDVTGAAPVAALRVDCRLADIDYVLILADEQAKLNVNAVMKVLGRTEAPATIGDLLRSGDTASIHAPEVRLRPRLVRSQADADISAVEGFGQVFESATPGQLIGDGSDSGVTGKLTCWGDGRLNVQRADAESIRLLCTKPLGGALVEQLLDGREDQPMASLEQLLVPLAGSSKEAKAKAGQYLTDVSRCHAVWLIAQGEQRHHFGLAIRVSNENGKLMRRDLITW